MFSFVAALYLLETKQVGKEQSELSDLMLGLLCEETDITHLYHS